MLTDMLYHLVKDALAAYFHLLNEAGLPPQKALMQIIGELNKLLPQCPDDPT